MPGRVIRLRSIDTNAIGWPSRLLRVGVNSAERFAKCATVVAKRYSVELDSGPALMAQTSWVRLVPTDMPGPALFTGVPMTADLGLGEVHQVPYDRAVLALPDDDRRLAILDWLHGHLLTLAAALGWDRGPLEAAYAACRRDACRFVQQGTPKTSPNRRYRAQVVFEIDGEGDGWSWIVVTDRTGAVVHTSDRRDSPPTITASARIRRSLRWHGTDVTWTPWTDDVAPKEYPWWLGHVEQLAITDSQASP